MLLWVRLIGWRPYVGVDFYSTGSEDTNPQFTGRIYFQTGSMPLLFKPESILFDTRGLLRLPGVRYDARIEIHHPNLPWKIFEDVELIAQLEDEPVQFTCTSQNPNPQSGIFPNQNWSDISEGMRIISADAISRHNTRPICFGRSSHWNLRLIFQNTPKICLSV